MPMLTEERHRGIADVVRREGAVTVVELSDRFTCSEATIRRDLDQLAQEGRVRRVRGGACDPRTGRRPEADPRAFAEVARSGVGAKRDVGRAAGALVSEGDVIALDIGTTVAAMCPFLVGTSVTVVTSSLAVVRELGGAEGIDLVVLGGQLRPSYDSLVGPLTETALRGLRVDLAFLGTSGVRPDGAVLDTTASEVPIKRGLLEIATRSYLLADHDKFPGHGYLEVAPIGRFSGLVTDRPLGTHDLVLPDEEEMEVHLP